MDKNSLVDHYYAPSVVFLNIFGVWWPDYEKIDIYLGKYFKQMK